MNDRDRRIVEHILRHCEEIIETVDRIPKLDKQLQEIYSFSMEDLS